MSAWKARFGQPPDLKYHTGDAVVVKLPALKTGAKTLDLPGTEAMYLGAINKQTAIVYADGKVYNDHPTDLRPVRRGQLHIWSARYRLGQTEPLGQPGRTPQVAPNLPPTAVPKSCC
eukprot:GHVU01016925.1.p1 GENE.GHVU01016925.1~~GHVU01016925.1.p1  ORF type:complete len:117 (+),score=12.22 GHVU01016925.1:1394-1744(+)